MKRATITWSGKSLCNHMKKNDIDFDSAIQRGLVWDKEQKSKLIHSMIYGFSIPTISLVKHDKGYFGLDGRQRVSTLYSFEQGEFALVAVDADESKAVDENGNPTGVYPFVWDDDGNMENISGMTFDQLPEWAQDRIRDYTFSITYFEDMSEAEIREYFSRLNNGKPLSGIELTRVKAISIKTFQEIANHSAISDYAVTDIGKNRYKDELIAMYIYGMDTMDEPNFSTKVFRPWIQDELVSVEEKNDIIKGLDYVSALYTTIEEAMKADPENKSDKTVWRKVRTQNNFVSIAYAGILAARENVPEEKYVTTIYDFFNCAPTSKDEEYNRSVGQGSARPENVQRRKKAMDELMEGVN